MNKEIENIPVHKIITIERIEKLIYLSRGPKVLLDSDQAQFYANLDKAVKRNRYRFADDGMFQIISG